MRDRGRHDSSITSDGPRGPAATGDRARPALAAAGVLTTMLALGGSDGETGTALAQVRERLAAEPGAGDHTSPALDVMIGDFAQYHEAMAWITGTAAVVIIALSVSAWQRFSRTESADRRARRTRGSFGARTEGPSAFFQGGW